MDQEKHQLQQNFKRPSRLRKENNRLNEALGSVEEERNRVLKESQRVIQLLKNKQNPAGMIQFSSKGGDFRCCLELEYLVASVERSSKLS